MHSNKVLWYGSDAKNKTQRGVMLDDINAFYVTQYICHKTFDWKHDYGSEFGARFASHLNGVRYVKM